MIIRNSWTPALVKMSYEFDSVRQSVSPSVVLSERKISEMAYQFFQIFLREATETCSKKKKNKQLDFWKKSAWVRGGQKVLKMNDPKTRFLGF